MESDALASETTQGKELARHRVVADHDIVDLDGRRVVGRVPYGFGHRQHCQIERGRIVRVITREPPENILSAELRCQRLGRRARGCDMLVGQHERAVAQGNKAAAAPALAMITTIEKHRCAPCGKMSRHVGDHQRHRLVPIVFGEQERGFGVHGVPLP